MIVRIVAGKVQGNFAIDFQHFFVLLVMQFERHRVLTDENLTYGNALDAAGPLGPECAVLKVSDPHRLVEERQRLRADMTVEQELCLYRNLKKKSPLSTFPPPTFAFVGSRLLTFADLGTFAVGSLTTVLAAMWSMTLLPVPGMSLLSGRSLAVT